MKHDKEELARLQALPLADKVTLSQTRVAEFYEHYGGKVCVSFSGGKDSTALLHLVRGIYPDVRGVFCNTGLEYPEVFNHVLSFDNVDIIRPELSFQEVLEKYGWCYPTKDIAYKIYYARRGSAWALKAFHGLDKDGNFSEFKQGCKKWRYLIDSPFRISDKCCSIMKKRPMAKYRKENGMALILGTMAAESHLRRNGWLQTGCNAFHSGKSQPLSFWTEQDILAYIKAEGLKIPAVYGDIVDDGAGGLKCSGESRTGCVFCPVGVHLETGLNKFQRLERTHPKLHDYCMNRLGLKELLEFVGVDWRNRFEQQRLFK